MIAACFVVVPSRAQDSAKKAAAAKKAASPKPAASASEALVKQWNEIGRKLIDMSEDSYCE
jgi:hypothetical protein